MLEIARIHLTSELVFDFFPGKYYPHIQHLRSKTTFCSLGLRRRPYIDYIELCTHIVCLILEKKREDDRC